jgi:hypothetical protein
METNQLNTGSLEDLKPGQTLLVNAREVKNGKIHLEFAEVIKSGSQPTNVLSLLNKSDERFSSNARRAWVTAEPIDATEYFGVDFGERAEWYMSDKGNILDLNILNPTMNGERCRLLISETTEATEWQNANLKTAAKRRGKEGDYITHQGAYVFSNTSIILSKEEDTSELHTFLQSDVEAIQVAQPIKELADIDSMM